MDLVEVDDNNEPRPPSSIPSSIKRSGDANSIIRTSILPRPLLSILIWSSDIQQGFDGQSIIQSPRLTRSTPIAASANGVERYPSLAAILQIRPRPKGAL
ncbi:hypothetical protein I7I51_08916 [Histoplasma capsulatum]|uniref:Uncharacterized protein n=1 Tax=Ajellomyces capsulatus TaxID=5037 RepID=A0A8A1M0H2_AJECA|nr:hypothetical protein I7I51_08916 [Histoplasma capsulatum]